MTDWGVPLDDGYGPRVAPETLAPELRTNHAPAPTAAADVYALGRLAYFILSGGRRRPDDQAAPANLQPDNLSALLPYLDDLEMQFPGATDVLAAWLIDRQPVAESLQSQYLLLLSLRNDDVLGLLEGEL